MSFRKKNRLTGWLAARLTAWYALTCLLLALFTAGLLYWALSANLSRSEDLFLADKVHVLRAILQERPDDLAGLKEEVELESAARRYAQFYVRLLDGRGQAVLTTPGMDALLSPSAFAQSVSANVEPSRGAEIRSASNQSFRILAAAAGLKGPEAREWVVQVAVDRGFDQVLLANYRKLLWAVLAAAVVLCPLIGYRIAQRGI